MTIVDNNDDIYKRLKLELKQKEMQIEGYECDLHDLSTQLASFAQQAHEASFNLKHAQNELNSYKSQREMLLSTLEDMKQIVCAKESQISLLEHELEDSRTKLTTVCGDLEYKQSLIQCLVDEKQNTEYELDRCLKVRNELDNKLVETEQEVSRLLNESKELRAELEEKSVAVDMVQEVLNKFSNLNKMVVELEEGLNQSAFKYRELETLYEAKDRELIEAKERLDDKNLEFKILFAKVEVYSKDIEKFEVICGKINADVENISLKYKTAVEDLRNKLYAKETEKCDLEVEMHRTIEKIKVELDEKSKSVDYLERHESEIREKCENLLQDNEILHQKGEKYQALFEEKTIEMEKVLKEKEKLENRLSEVEEQREKDRQESKRLLSNQTQEICSLQKELEARNSENKTLKESLEIHQEEAGKVKQLVNKISDYAETIQNMEERLKEVDELQDRCAALTEERNQWKERCEMLENQTQNVLKRQKSPIKVETKRRNIGDCNFDGQKIPLGKPPIMPSTLNETRCVKREECKQQ